MKQLKRFLSLLLCLALLTGLVPSALAGQDIGLSVTTPSSSSGKLKLSWDKAANVDYYAYSIRDLNTDELLADRKTTTKTYANVSGDWVSGHTYRIWVGACCDGNDPDNTSSWDYTEQTTVTIYVCSHSNTDVAWDTDYSITYKSVSDTQHKMSGYMYTYCVDCYERVDDSYKTSKNYNHTFKSNGDCEVCDYTAGCSHDSTRLVEKSGYPVYKLDDEEEHIVDIQYERVCRDCDEVLDYLVDDARDYYREEHTFNSKGVCKYCDYVKPEEQEPLTVSVSNNQSSAEAGETISANAYASGGTGSYKYAWKVTCNGSIVSETDLGMGAYYTYCASKAGTYVFTAYVRDSDGTQVSDSASSITVNEPACQHPATEASWSTKKSITYKSISDTQHSMSGYMGNYCTTCYEQVGDLYATTKNYAHSYDDAGDCTVCDYKYSCKHTQTTYRLLSGFPAYKMVDAEKHTYTEKYEEVCANASCGKVVTMLADDKTVVERRAHTFNSNGKCTDCGYQKVAAPLSIKVSRGQSSSETGKNISASASASGGSGGYKYAWKVTRDGATVDETDLGMGSNYSYFAEKAGSYVFIAYVKDSEGSMVSASSSAITVEAASCAHENYKDVNGTPSYRTESDARHIKVTPVRRVCSDCGKQISSWNKEKSEDHSFTNNRCTDCGLLTAGSCEHPNAYDDLTSSVISGTGTAQKHTLTRTYAVICPDCNETVRTYTKNASAEHSFNDNGVCKCGYAKPVTHDHANKTEKALKDPVYENKGADGHLKTTFTAVYCADCGTLLQQEKTRTVAEGHKYTNGVCVCSHQEHVHTYQNRLTGKPAYTNLSPEIHEVTGACTPTCSTCGATAAETSYTWTEKHNYTTRGRIQAKHEGNGHATFNRCACGAVEYTGYAKYDNCCQCYGHKWEPSDAAGYEKCSRCGESRAATSGTSPDADHKHLLARIISADHAHPHKIVGSCECGETIELLHSSLTCCLCVGHNWGDIARLPDGSYRQGCLVCNEWQTVTPSEEQLAFYKVVDIITQTREDAAEYQEDRKIDSSSSSIWKTVAGQATDKLTDKGFVYTTEALNAYSDMSGTIVGAFTEESWDQQQADLWESLLIQMLRGQYKEIENTNGIDALGQFGDDAGNITDNIKEHSTELSTLLASQSEAITDSINEIDQWLIELDQQSQALDRVGDYDGAMEIRQKYIELRTLKNEYDASLSEVNTDGKIASDVKKVTADVTLVMNILSVVSDGTSAATSVAQRNNAFADMLINGENNVAVLESIIQTAEATGNANLSAAATKVKKELESEIKKQTNQFLSETGAFFSGVLVSTGEQVLSEGFEELVELAAEHGSGTIAGIAGTAVKDSLAILGVIELGAKGLKSIVGWDKVYDEAQQLMTISHMDATLGILQTLNEEDSQYVAELWTLLQMQGCEQAQTFLNEWENANWLSTDEFGVGKEDLVTVINQLTSEKNYYKSSLDLSFE